MKRFFIKVSGKVQGVGFRYYTQQKAQQLGLKGWVRNEMDGTVEIEAEGDESSLEELISFIKKGSEPSWKSRSHTSGRTKTEKKRKEIYHPILITKTQYVHPDQSKTMLQSASSSPEHVR